MHAPLFVVACLAGVASVHGGILSTTRYSPSRYVTIGELDMMISTHPLITKLVEYYRELTHDVLVGSDDLQGGLIEEQPLPLDNTLDSTLDSTFDSTLDNTLDSTLDNSLDNIALPPEVPETSFGGLSSLGSLGSLGSQDQFGAIDHFPGTHRGPQDFDSLDDYSLDPPSTGRKFFMGMPYYPAFGYGYGRK